MEAKRSTAKCGPWNAAWRQYISERFVEAVRRLGFEEVALRELPVQ